MADKKKRSREAKRDALAARQEAERERERAELHAPRDAQVPTRLIRVGPLVERQADIADEHFGGFTRADAERPAGSHNGKVTKAWFIGVTGFGGRVDVPAKHDRDAAFDGRKAGARGGLEVIWPRSNISLDRLGRRQGGASKPTIGPEHRVRRVLDSRRKIAWQRKPDRWAAEQPTNGLWPFMLRGAWEAIGFERARQRGAEPDRDYRHRPDPLASYAGALPAMHKPKRTENARWPKLPRVEIKLFPKGKVDRVAARSEMEMLVAAYLAIGGPIGQCPAETTTAMLNKRPEGRPPIYGVAMTNAQHQQAWYWRDKAGKLLPFFNGMQDLPAKPVLFFNGAKTDHYNERIAA